MFYCVLSVNFTDYYFSAMMFITFLISLKKLNLIIKELKKIEKYKTI